MKYEVTVPPSSTEQKISIDIPDYAPKITHAVTGTTPIKEPEIPTIPEIPPPNSDNSGYELVYERGFDVKSEITTTQGARNTLSTSVTKDSKGSFRSEVRASDAAQSSGYRGEIQFTEDAANPKEGRIEYDVLYEKVFGSNGHSFQLHPHYTDRSATLALWHSGGKFQVVRSVQKDANIYGKVLQTIEANRWYHMVWEFKLTTAKTGYIRLFIDGKLVHEETNVITDVDKGSYLKIGVNRWKPMTGDSIMYTDNLRVFRKK